MFSDQKTTKSFEHTVTNLISIKMASFNFHHRKLLYGCSFWPQKSNTDRKLMLLVGRGVCCLFSLGRNVFVYPSILSACPEVKVNENTTAANLLPSPTGCNEQQLPGFSQLAAHTRTHAHPSHNHTI